MNKILFARLTYCQLMPLWVKELQALSHVRQPNPALVFFRIAGLRGMVGIAHIKMKCLATDIKRYADI